MRYKNISEKWGDAVEVKASHYIEQAKAFGVVLGKVEVRDDGIWIDDVLVAEPIADAVANQDVCVVRKRNVYKGTLGIDGHARILTRHDVDDVCVGAAAVEPRTWANAAEAQAWIDEQEEGVYTTQNGEAGRPEYWIVSEDAAYALECRAQDLGNYDWPEDAETECGNCGECDRCIEWMAEQDENLLREEAINA